MKILVRNGFDSPFHCELSVGKQGGTTKPPHTNLIQQYSSR